MYSAPRDAATELFSLVVGEQPEHHPKRLSSRVLRIDPTTKPLSHSTTLSQTWYLTTAQRTSGRSKRTDPESNEMKLRGLKVNYIQLDKGGSISCRHNV